MLPKERFVLEVEKYRSSEQGKNTWDQLLCKVMEVREDGSRIQIGKFVRSYHALYNTWEPFEQNGKFFALCSPDYTATSVMALPECEIIATEKGHSFGFCPTGFFVPTQMKDNINDNAPEDLPVEWLGQFGFVCGCVWGDDGSWKVQFLDLSEISQGKLTRDERFGYVELPGGSDTLNDYVFVDGSTGAFPGRLIVHIVHQKDWFGGLKWTAKASDGENNFDLNIIADKLRDNILHFIEQAMDKEQVPDQLKKDSFKEEIRILVMNEFSKFAMEE